MSLQKKRAPYLTWPKGKDCWQIRANGQYKSTGTMDRREADAKLASYILDQAKNPAQVGSGRSATLSMALEIY